MSDNTVNSFARLFADSRKALRRYISKLVHSRDTADDIVQEAYLRTYEHVDKVQNPRAFLFSTARNLAYDVSRRNRTQKTQTLGDFEDSDVIYRDVIYGDGSLERLALADEESRLLREAIENLTPQCRTVFALRIFHSCSYKEIARRLDISPKTVESHVARALRDTHKYLKQRDLVK